MTDTIYRSTRNPGAGVYYLEVTAKQRERIIARWLKKERQGSLKGDAHGNLMQLLRSPHWILWKVVRRIRGRDRRVRETVSYWALPPKTKMRVVKHKPAPLYTTL